MEQLVVGQDGAEFYGDENPVSSEHDALLAEQKTLCEKLDGLWLELTPAHEHKKVLSFMDNHRMIQHEYRKGSITGAVIKAIFKNMYSLAWLLHECIDEELAEDLLGVLEPLKIVWRFCCLTEQNKEGCSAKVTPPQMDLLKSSIQTVKQRFYSFIKVHGVPPKARVASKQQLNVGFKIHLLDHIPDKIAADNGLRPVYLNEENTEHMVQKLAKADHSYRTFHGEQRLNGTSRSLQLQSLQNYFYPPNNYGE